MRRTVVSVSEPFQQRVRRPGFWWSWSGAFAVLGLGVGFAPIVLYDSNCGSALHPTNSAACGGNLDVRFNLSLTLLAVALVLLAIGLLLSQLTWWRSLLCFAGIIGVAAFSFVAMSALTHDEDATVGYCGTYISQPQYEGDAQLQAKADGQCGPFRSRQLRLALGAVAAAIASGGAIAVAVRVGRKREPVPPFVPNLG
jgi:hypothetical protein